MTAAEIKRYRYYGDRFKGSHRSAKMILELCDEVERLQNIADERNGSFSDCTLMPIGKQYRGRRLIDIPDNYFRWWLRENDRASLVIDAQFSRDFAVKTIAAKKIRLFDYITERLNGEAIQNTGNGNGNGNGAAAHNYQGGNLSRSNAPS